MDGVVRRFAKGTGAEEIIAAVFGCLTSILNGKYWTNAFRAFRMLGTTLLYDYLSEG